MSLTTIFIASPEGANGRNVVANGVTAALAQDNRKTAIFHPITCRHDAFTDVLIHTAGADETLEQARVICPNRAILDHDTARDEIVRRWESFVPEMGADAVVIVGRDKRPTFDPEGFTLDTQVSADLKAPVFLAVCCISRSPKEVQRTVAACASETAKAGSSVAGIFITGWDPHDIDKAKDIREELSASAAPVWIIPAHSCTTDEEAAASLKLFQQAAPAAEVLAAIDRSDFRRPETPYAFQAELLTRAKADKKTIVLPEGEEGRILKAADYLLERDIVDLIIVGRQDKILSHGRELGLQNLRKAHFQAMDDESVLGPMADKLCELRAKKGMTPEQARETLKDPSYFGTMLVVLGKADGLVSGSVNTTAATVRPALQLIKTRPDVSLVSGAFIMCFHDHIAVFADCAINLNPTAQQLADIAVQSSQTARAFGIDPKVGMLSYSTLGSGSGPDVDLVEEATRLVSEKAPELPVVGPIQMDAAWSPEVAATKAKGNPVAGHVNVFVFPSLSVGNIGYKAVQRSSGALAIGPVLQGLNRPVNDLSRGALVADIINTIALTAVYAQE